MSFTHLPVLLAHDDLAGVVVEAQSPLKRYISGQIAARDGAILPMITAQTPNILFNRLVMEKTVSIDTTAAGGNTSLMTMDVDNEIECGV